MSHGSVRNPGFLFSIYHLFHGRYFGLYPQLAQIKHWATQVSRAVLIYVCCVTSVKTMKLCQLTSARDLALSRCRCRLVPLFSFHRILSPARPFWLTATRSQARQLRFLYPASSPSSLTPVGTGVWEGRGSGPLEVVPFINIDFNVNFM